MFDPLWPLLITAAGIVTLLTLWYAGALTQPPVTAWTKVGRHHGLVDPRPFAERVGERLPFLRRLFKEANVPRLLAIAGSNQSGTAWALRTGGIALALMAGLLCVDWLSGLSERTLPFPPVLPLLFGLTWTVLAYTKLRRSARHRQERLQLALSDSLPELAMLTFTGQMAVEAAVDFVSRVHADRTLYVLFKDDSWRQLADIELSAAAGLEGTALISTADIYQSIGRSYEVPMFTLLASSMRRMSAKGLPPRRVLTNLARSVGNARLADMAVRSEQARVRLAIPVGLMVVPLLVLLGYPSMAAVAGAFSH